MECLKRMEGKFWGMTDGDTKGPQPPPSIANRVLPFEFLLSGYFEFLKGLLFRKMMMICFLDTVLGFALITVVLGFWLMVFSMRLGFLSVEFRLGF